MICKTSESSAAKLNERKSGELCAELNFNMNRTASCNSISYRRLSNPQERNVKRKLELLISEYAAGKVSMAFTRLELALNYLANDRYRYWIFKPQINPDIPIFTKTSCVAADMSYLSLVGFFVWHTRDSNWSEHILWINSIDLFSVAGQQHQMKHHIQLRCQFFLEAAHDYAIFHAQP